MRDSQKPTDAQKWKMAWMNKQELRGLIDSGQIMVPEPIADNLAGISELAARYDVQPNTVAVWTQRHDDFPKPLIQIGGRVRVWWVPDVDEWVQNRKETR